MEATTIAHLTGQMVTILEMIEFSIQQTDIKDYQTKFLMEQINEAKAVNDKIFEMHKRKNEFGNRIKKLIIMGAMKTNKSNKSGLGRKGKAMYFPCN